MTLNLFDQDALMEDYLKYLRNKSFEEGYRIGKIERRAMDKYGEEFIKDLIQKMRAKGYTEEQIADLLE